jgi:hypothetical protein
VGGRCSGPLPWNPGPELCRQGYDSGSIGSGHRFAEDQGGAPGDEERETRGVDLWDPDRPDPGFAGRLINLIEEDDDSARQMAESQAGRQGQEAGGAVSRLDRFLLPRPDQADQSGAKRHGLIRGRGASGVQERSGHKPGRGACPARHGSTGSPQAPLRSFIRSGGESRS